MSNGKSRAAPGRPAPSPTTAPPPSSAEVVSTVTQAEDSGTLTTRVRQIIEHEAAGDGHQWEAARLIAAELGDGTSQRHLAGAIGKSQTHVSLMAACWRRWGDYPGNRPPFCEAYRECKSTAPRRRETRDHEGWRLGAEAAYRRAEADCRGHLLSRLGETRRVDPEVLWAGSETIARKYASAELCRWWDEHGRLTVGDYAAQAARDRAAERSADASYRRASRESGRTGIAVLFTLRAHVAELRTVRGVCATLRAMNTDDREKVRAEMGWLP